MFTLPLLVFFLASVIDGQGPQKTPLPGSMRLVFEEFNRQYKPLLEWSDYLATKALLESEVTQSVKGSLKVKATRLKIFKMVLDTDAMALPTHKERDTQP
ncbi:hypothetical protein OSTOST_11962 [Ostertagia ostertagi]